MLLRCHPWFTLCVGGLALISGALPAAFAYLVGRLVDRLTNAIENAEPGPWIPGSVTGVMISIAIVLTLQPMIAAVSSILATELYWRHDRTILSRVMTTVTRGHTLVMHEDPEVAAHTDRAVRIARFGPGELVSGLHAKWTAQAQGVFAAILVASISPIGAIALFVLWFGLARFLRADFYRANPFWTDPLRRADYLKRLGLRPEAAKEIRVFGLTEWLTDRFGTEWARVTAELWRSRRIGGHTMSLLTIALLIAHLIVVLLGARAAVDANLTVADLTVLIQGVFGMAMLASLDGDIWIENGAVPVPDILEHERMVAQRHPDVRSPRASRPVSPDAPSGATDGSALTDGTAAPPDETASADSTAPAAHPSSIPSGNTSRCSASARPGRTLPAVLPRQQIRLDGVGFGYPGGHRIYESLDLTIEAGRSLAIVGLNGAGKTTLVKLLTGLWLPDSGRILVDDEDLAELVASDPERWRQQLAVIFQDFVRFPFTAMQNVGVGATPSGPWQHDLVRRAADRAGALDLIEQLPAGWDTPLSRRYTGGLDLSGGQWQRIALARAMAAVEAGARVLVLDEPTAQLDARAEAELYNRFLDVTRGLTSIVISHRFSTVRRADRIVVVEHGLVVESGTHEELLTHSRRYATLFRAQASRYRDQTEPEDEQ